MVGTTIFDFRVPDFSETTTLSQTNVVWFDDNFVDFCDVYGGEV